MFLRSICIAACLLVCGCASTQLNYNTADLASSLNSLTKRQIFFNLAQALTDPEFVPSQRLFLCEYPLQSFNVSPTGGNIIFRIDDCPNNNTRESRSRVVHVDPTFTQGPSCIICIDDLNAKHLRPHINPNLKYHFIRTQKTGDMVSIGSHGTTTFYVCGSAEGDCPRAEQQVPFDGRKALSDFILFVYEAVTVPSTTGGGRQTGASFVYSVR